MKISQEWLKDLIDLPWTGEELARQLTAIGLPVDAIETTGLPLEGFVVGRVIEAERHPNADRLTLCRVDVGEAELLQIICGAPNARVGVRAAVARVGAMLPDGTRIKRAKIRGVESEGMMCSERELGLSQEHAGIIDLGEGAPPPGTPLSEALTVGDALFEIDIPSNRGDCFSHLGVAREIMALAGLPLRPPDTSVSEAGERAGDLTSVTVSDPEGSPRYIARLITGVRVGPSPPWLVTKLAAIGQRSINNIVDVTNLVLWEMGQPLHAFDFDRLHGHRIIVRRAVPGERLTTLDGHERALSPEVLVIADQDRPVALAGIMGGEETEVTDTTTTVLLEGAWFDPFRTLRGSSAVRLTTDASLRFIRGIDPSMTPAAIDRCARLFTEVAGGRVLGGRVEVLREGFLAPREVTYRPGAARRLLGEEIPDTEALAILERLGFRPAAAEGPKLQGTGRPAPNSPELERPVRLTVPAWRLDVRQECDLVDDVARLRGYDRLEERSYNMSGLSAARSTLDLGIARVRRAWLSLGFTEMVNRALADPDDMVKAGIPAEEVGRSGVFIPEPSSREEGMLRLSLLPGALRAVAHNIHHGRPDLRLFEVGVTYRRSAGETGAEEPLELLAVATAGQFGPDLTRLDPVMDYSRFKGVVEAFLAVLRVDTPRVRCYDASQVVGAGPDSGSRQLFSSVSDFQAETSAIIEARGQGLGILGLLAPEIGEAFDISRPVFVARFALPDLLNSIPEEVRYREPSRFPDSRRDLAFLVDQSISEARVAEAIRRLGGELLQEATLFDRFSGGSLPPGKVSLAYALRFQAWDHTLSDEEVRSAERRIVHGLDQELGATLRDR